LGRQSCLAGLGRSGNPGRGWPTGLIVAASRCNKPTARQLHLRECPDGDRRRRAGHV